MTFPGIAGLLVEPTTDKGELLAAIDTLRTGRGTAVGLAILASVDAIAEINPDVPPTGVEVREGGVGAGAAGGYQPDVVVVLTDGRNTHGVDPLTAAGVAAARDVRVYTIGFGTTEPSPLVCTRDQISGDAAFRGGEYFQAEDAEALSEVLRNLPDSIVLQRRQMEMTVWFALTGAVLVLGAVVLSEAWHRFGPFPSRRTGE